MSEQRINPSFILIVDNQLHIEPIQPPSNTNQSVFVSGHKETIELFEQYDKQQENETIR